MGIVMRRIDHVEDDGITSVEESDRALELMIAGSACTEEPWRGGP